MYSKGDFHLHTTSSDGKLSPEELVRLGKAKALDIIAVTDHDTTLGLERAKTESKLSNVCVIPGIELSTLHNNESVHLLGYFMDDKYKDKEFQIFLQNMKAYRVNRAKNIVGNLKKFFDISIDYDKVFKSAKGVIARPHIAKAIIEAGYSYTWDYIFDNIISKESPAYVPNKEVSIPEGIQILKDVNAIVCLAHPVLIKKSKPEALVNFDFDGIEAIYPLNSPDDTAMLTDLAKSHKKLITAGSDYHGSDLGDTKHGDIGCVYLEGTALNELTSRLGL
jgi:3',5'-nucleoside bisphosphate phosphatase